ncbi:MAG: DUF2971 domain-containing protein [Bacteroidetes bacterium]|nr:DUF2971 domain-containing protein [Bacteroidota bacterium]
MNIFQIDDQQELRQDGQKWILFKNNVPQPVGPHELYKYYALEDYNLEALEQGYLYFNNPQDFNDPFDCNYNLIKEQQRIAKDWETLFAPNDVGNKGITCFSENGMQPLMWGHYAKAYCGFVVKYSTNLKFESLNGINKAKLLRVIYSTNPKPINQDMPFANQYQLSVKLSGWCYEQEWRLVIDKLDLSVDKLYFKKQIVQEIYLGYQLYVGRNSKRLQDKRKKLERILKEIYPNVRKQIVTPHESRLELIKRPLVNIDSDELLEAYLKGKLTL